MSQAESIFQLLYDQMPHRTDEIVRKCYGEKCSLARLAARIYDLRKKGYMINGWRDDENETLYWYQLISRVPFDCVLFEATA